ncbi:helix-turn-helix transcriptional regulator [Phytoactinopolyspora halotolerans]|uniref:Helix-turn-helix transcriptional regulator n=1 Tax=Phytoactinopolyspora halotolerans TaxID=1981512 RepID=A0A6L9SH59_9ACTN|nr:helix-turn-helix transcriptional regulator [Phytoactinopolyspora halotolerans]NEE04443.1 helix-turn-helix transcriptional regulator [Phytoactinopolyspora halotolerans]
MYREWPSVVEHTVVWTARAEGRREDRMVLPDGCMDLLWLDGELVIAGPDTAAYHTTWTPSVYVGLRFAAGVGPCVIGVPAREVRDQRVPLAQIWPSAEVRRLSERLGQAAHPPSRILEKVVLDRLADGARPDPVAEFAVEMLGRGMSVESVADAVGFSERQLRRRSLDAFGYGPKTLARIIRLNRALDLGRLGRQPAEAALVAGYSDQAHLARDVKALTGTTFTSLVSDAANEVPGAGQASSDGRAANRSTSLPSGSLTEAYRWPQKASHGSRSPG